MSWFVSKLHRLPNCPLCRLKINIGLGLCLTAISFSVHNTLGLCFSEKNVSWLQAYNEWLRAGAPFHFFLWTAPAQLDDNWNVAHEIYDSSLILPCFIIYRLPVVNDCPGQTARVTSNNLHSSSSTMAVSRVPSPPLPEVNTPVAENWCYTQVSHRSAAVFLLLLLIKLSEPWPYLRLCGSLKLFFIFFDASFIEFANSKRLAQGNFSVSVCFWRMNGMNRSRRLERVD